MPKPKTKSTVASKKSAKRPPAATGTPGHPNSPQAREAREIIRRVFKPTREATREDVSKMWSAFEDAWIHCLVFSDHGPCSRKDIAATEYVRELLCFIIGPLLDSVRMGEDPEYAKQVRARRRQARAAERKRAAA